MESVLDKQEMRQELLRFVKSRASQKQAADEIGISQAYLSDILRGQRHISDKVAQFLGYTRDVIFYCASDHKELSD